MALCDGVVEIPTYGVKNSLNVAAAAPIVVYEVLRQWKARDAPTPEATDAPPPTGYSRHV